MTTSRLTWSLAALCSAALTWAQAAQAKVTKITILKTTTPVCTGTVCHANYEAVSGLAEGDPVNALSGAET